MHSWSQIRKVWNGPKNIFFTHQTVFALIYTTLFCFSWNSRFRLTMFRQFFWCFINQCPNNFLKYTFFASNWIYYFCRKYFLINQKYMQFWLTKTACNFGPLNLISNHFKHILPCYTHLFWPWELYRIEFDAKLCPWEAVAYWKKLCYKGKYPVLLLLSYIWA